MTVCKHCGEMIVPAIWYDGPGWRHDLSGGYACRPATFAEPAEVVQ